MRAGLVDGRSRLLTCAVVAVLVPTPLAGAASESAAAPPPRTALGKTLLESRTFGHSVKGRPLTARLYGDAASTRVAVVIGSMHGTELAGVRIAKRLRATGVPSNVAFWIIDNLNPDGAAAGRRQNAHGVDVNRNGSDLWKRKARSPEYYPGPYSRSEPETNAYISFLDSVDPDVVLIYHQAGNGVDSYHAHNQALVRGLATRMKLPVRPFNCDGECTGTLTGWFNKQHAGSALTIELTSRVTRKKVKRWANAARWASTFVPDGSTVN